MDLVTVLSPHQDDSAFSLAITICALVNAGHRVRIVNCFTVSNYAPYAAAATSTGEIRQIRRLEDREFVSRIGHGVDVIDLDMLDAPLRLDCPVSAVRRRTMNARDDTDARRIAGVLIRLTGRMLLAPAGLGNHIDHLVAREAGLRMSAAGYPVGFYEDLPYAAESRECCIVRTVRQLSRDLRRRLTASLVRDPAGTERKRFLIEAYRSQVAAEQIDAVIDYASRHGDAERLWMTEDAAREFSMPVEAVTTAPASFLRCAAHAAADRGKALIHGFAQPALFGGNHVVQPS